MKKMLHSLGLELDSHKHKPLEITTLSEVPSKIPEFFQSNFKPPKLKVENIQSTVDVAKVVENLITIKCLYKPWLYQSKVYQQVLFCTY